MTLDLAAIERYYGVPLTPPTNPYRYSPFLTTLREGLTQAKRLGHRLCDAMPDVVRDSAIATCDDCGRYMVVDMEESKTAYGSGVKVPCTIKRQRPWGKPW